MALVGAKYFLRLISIQKAPEPPTTGKTKSVKEALPVPVQPVGRDSFPLPFTFFVCFVFALVQFLPHFKRKMVKRPTSGFAPTHRNYKRTSTLTTFSVQRVLT